MASSFQSYSAMRKAGLVSRIKDSLKQKSPHLQTADIVNILDAFIEVVKAQFVEAANYGADGGENKKFAGDIYLRNFGSFVAKVRAKKIGRNIKKNKAVEIPAHTILTFKPAKTFADAIKKSNLKIAPAEVVEVKEADKKTKTGKVKKTKS